MPYILPAQRVPIDEKIAELSQLIETQGELNYAITRLVCMSILLPLTYVKLSEARAVLMDVYHEFTRKVMDKYEDKKEIENGSVHHIP